ncbi:MAG: CGLD27 family protein [Leptolyngbya sp. SIO1D8]|nr:CGLD27 family protein [Leptolyngbya sp. SIO1D8]
MMSRCPVPIEQRPINQYQDISQSWFYSWGSREIWPYSKPLVVLWCMSWFVTGPVAAASFAPSKYPLPFVIWAAVGALLLPLLTLAQLYVGWLHVGHRLQQEEVPYEESGWYDGQVWQKPEDVLNRDRLIMMYEVQPILKRVRNTLSVLIAVGVALLATGQFL